MNRFLYRAANVAYLFTLMLVPLGALANWTVEGLDELKNAFFAGISSNYKVDEYPWQFLDTTNCFEPGRNCLGTNPDSPYGFVNFGSIGGATRMVHTGALVLIKETPPPMRYFGLTPYIATRFYESQPLNPGQPGLVPVFENLGDSINVTNVKTAGSPIPGEDVFGQLSVFVMTADSRSYEDIHSQFVALGFPDHAINQIVLPVNEVPLIMGNTLKADTFAIIVRLAYPDDADGRSMQDYIAKAPIRAALLRPLRNRPLVALPAPVSKTPGSEPSQPVSLWTAREQLVADLTARYASAGYTVTEADFSLRVHIAYFCTTWGLRCSGANPDGRYATDLQSFRAESRQDKILIVGVNHVDTGKALYINHSIVNEEFAAGVKAANDDYLRGSALLMAAIDDPNDPRYDTYSQLYAYTISYDCSGEIYCMTIPVPTGADPAGVPFGDALNISSRYYVDPATGTRPGIADVYKHRTFVLRR